MAGMAKLASQRVRGRIHKDFRVHPVCATSPSTRCVAKTAHKATSHCNARWAMACYGCLVLLVLKIFPSSWVMVLAVSSSF